MLSDFDPRDKVHALLGVTWGALGALKVDYSIPVEDLYTDVTLRVLERMNNLDIWLFFMHSRDDSRHRKQSLPSWVVDWDLKSGVSEDLFALDYFRYRDDLWPIESRSTSEDKPRVCYHESENVLVVRGAGFGIIRSIAQDAWKSRKSSITEDGRLSAVSKLPQWLRFLDSEETKQISKFRRLITTGHWRLGQSVATDSTFEAWALLQQDQSNENPESALPRNFEPVDRFVEFVARGKRLSKTDNHIGLCPGRMVLSCP